MKVIEVSENDTSNLKALRKVGKGTAEMVSL